MLDKVQDEELRGIGLAREIAAHIQRFRKQKELNFDDPIEVFYDFEGKSGEPGSVLGKVIETQSESISKQIKVPFVYHTKTYTVLIGKTEFVLPENPEEKLSLWIHRASPDLNSPEMQEKIRKMREQASKTKPIDMDMWQEAQENAEIVHAPTCSHVQTNETK